MLYEWYSGCDSTKAVPHRINAFDSTYENLTADQRTNFLTETLGVERDRNWRGYLFTRLGREFEYQSRPDEAVRAYDSSLQEYDPYGANFQDVVDSYCRSLDGLVRLSYSDEKEPDRMVAAGIAILAFHDLTQLSMEERAILFGWLARGLTTLAYRTGRRILHELALPVALRAHHIQPEFPGYLRELVYCYFNLGNATMCEAAYRDYLRVAEKGEARDQLERFMMERFVEISDGRPPRIDAPS